MKKHLVLFFVCVSILVNSQTPPTEKELSYSPEKREKQMIKNLENYRNPYASQEEREKYCTKYCYLKNFEYIKNIVELKTKIENAKTIEELGSFPLRLWTMLQDEYKVTIYDCRISSNDGYGFERAIFKHEKTRNFKQEYNIIDILEVGDKMYYVLDTISKYHFIGIDEDSYIRGESDNYSVFLLWKKKILEIKKQTEKPKDQSREIAIEPFSFGMTEKEVKKLGKLEILNSGCTPDVKYDLDGKAYSFDFYYDWDDDTLMLNTISKSLNDKGEMKIYDRRTEEYTAKYNLLALPVEQDLIAEWEFNGKKIQVYCMGKTTSYQQKTGKTISVNPKVYLRILSIERYAEVYKQFERSWSDLSKTFDLINPKEAHKFNCSEKILTESYPRIGLQDYRLEPFKDEITNTMVDEYNTTGTRIIFNWAHPESLIKILSYKYGEPVIQNQYKHQNQLNEFKKKNPNGCYIIAKWVYNDKRIYVVTYKSLDSIFSNIYIYVSEVDYIEQLNKHNSNLEKNKTEEKLGF